jgi:hypothetical protein
METNVVVSIREAEQSHLENNAYFTRSMFEATEVYPDACRSMRARARWCAEGRQALLCCFVSSDDATSAVALPLPISFYRLLNQAEYAA